jgi:hypothetical protein
VQIYQDFFSDQYFSNVALEYNKFNIINSTSIQLVKNKKITTFVRANDIIISDFLVNLEEQLPYIKKIPPAASNDDSVGIIVDSPKNQVPIINAETGQPLTVKIDGINYRVICLIKWYGHYFLKFYISKQRDVLEEISVGSSKIRVNILYTQRFNNSLIDNIIENSREVTSDNIMASISIIEKPIIEENEEIIEEKLINEDITLENVSTKSIQVENQIIEIVEQPVIQDILTDEMIVSAQSVLTDPNAIITVDQIHGHKKYTMTLQTSASKIMLPVGEYFIMSSSADGTIFKDPIQVYVCGILQVSGINYIEILDSKDNTKGIGVDFSPDVIPSGDSISFEWVDKSNV